MIGEVGYTSSERSLHCFTDILIKHFEAKKKKKIKSEINLITCI